VGDGRIYAFIHSPLPNPTSTAEPETDWLKENMLGFLLVLMSIVIIVILVFYFAKRLWRYREKYHRERAEVEKMQEEVDNMEQFGGQAGRKDDEVAMSNNPMVLQVKDMQDRLQVTSQEMLEAELAQREQESEERAQHIGSLAKQREEMQNQLNKLQKQLSTVSDMDKATAVATRDDGGYSGGGGGGPPPVSKGPPPVKKTAFDNKPKKKTQKNF
jgi:flagellar biosynthesis/type III secretory pathway M-ring protein FliF/YscJ